MTNRAGFFSGERVANAAGVGLDVLAVYGLYRTTAGQAAISHEIAAAAQDACSNDPAVHAAVTEALAQQVGGGPIGGDVCSVMQTSSGMANVAQNTAERVARAGSGPYTDLLNTLHDRFTETTLVGSLSLAAILLSIAAFGIAGQIKRRRTSR